MKKAMITVCGDFGDRHWVSDIMLTCVSRLSSALGQNGCEVVCAGSMDNAEMRDIVRSFASEADFVRAQNDVNALFIVYKDEIRSNSFYAAFNHLREALPRRIALVLVDIGNHEALTRGQKILLSQLRGLYLLHGIKGTDKETVKILLRDIALGV